MKRRMKANPNRTYGPHGVGHDESKACTDPMSKPNCAPAPQTMVFGTLRELLEALDRIELEGADASGGSALKRVSRVNGAECIEYADGSVLRFKVRRGVVDDVALGRSHTERAADTRLYAMEADAARAAVTPAGEAAPDANPKAYDPPPKHYDGNGIDPWAVWDAFDLDRYTANAVKYLLRAGKKDIAPRLDDLKKARNYINKAIEREETK